MQVGRRALDRDLGDSIKWNPLVGFAFLCVAAYFIFRKW